MAWRGWIAVVLTACSGAPPADGSGGSGDDDDTVPLTGCSAEMTVDAGTGATSFLSLNTGDPVTMVHGPQGGWHVDLAGVVAATAQEVSVGCALVVPSLGDLQIAGDQQPQYLALAAYDAMVCDGEFWGVRCFIDDVESPPGGVNYQEFICSLEGLPMDLSVTVSDISEGTACTEAVTVTAELDPSDVVACE